MKFEEYIGSLRRCQEETSFIELDKDREIHYLEAEHIGLTRLLREFLIP